MKLFLNKFKNAFAGFVLACKDVSILIQVALCICAIALSFYFKISMVEWCIVLLCCALVIVSEMINTAIEYLCDFVQPQYHEMIRRIKDLSAAFVLVAAVFSAIIAIIIFGGRIW